MATQHSASWSDDESAGSDEADGSPKASIDDPKGEHPALNAVQPSEAGVLAKGSNQSCTMPTTSVATRPSPSAAGGVAKGPSPSAAGGVAKEPSPSAAGGVAKGPSPSAAGGVAKGPSPSVAGGIATGPSPSVAIEGFSSKHVPSNAPPDVPGDQESNPEDNSPWDSET